MTETDRRVQVPGTSNLRDLGGYRTSADTLVARGRVYRSEALVMPGGRTSYAIYEETAHAQYLGLGLRTVIDLRSVGEMRTAPTAWASVCGADLVEIPIAEGGEGADTNYMRLLVTGEMTRFDIHDMTAFYIRLVENRAEQLGEAIRVVAQSDRLPVLIHCAAGKDRTGVLVALILSALGVPDEQVVDDFALTGILRPNRVDAYAHLFVEAGRDPEIARVLFESPPESMVALLDHLRTEYGSSVGYLTDRAGVDESVITDLRLALTVPS